MAQRPIKSVAKGIDLLFLFSDRDAEQAFKDPVRRFSQELWDLRLKLSPASRTLSECDRYDPNNTEFISNADPRMWPRST